MAASEIQFYPGEITWIGDLDDAAATALREVAAKRGPRALEILESHLGEKPAPRALGGGAVALPYALKSSPGHHAWNTIRELRHAAESLVTSQLTLRHMQPHRRQAFEELSAFSEMIARHCWSTG